MIAQVGVQVLNPNAHEREKLRDSHGQSNRLLQLNARDAVLIHQRFDVAQKLTSIVCPLAGRFNLLKRERSSQSTAQCEIIQTFSAI